MLLILEAIFQATSLNSSRLGPFLTCAMCPSLQALGTGVIQTMSPKPVPQLFLNHLKVLMFIFIFASAWSQISLELFEDNPRKYQLLIFQEEVHLGFQ